MIEGNLLPPSPAIELNESDRRQSNEFLRADRSSVIEHP